MNVAGIDFSTHAVDIVKLGFDSDQATWDRFDLVGERALERVCSAVTHVPRGSYWDDCALVAIERPYGPGRDILFHLHVAVGCVTAALPDRLRPPWMLHPAEWRKACGMAGNASKDDVRDFAWTWAPLLWDRPPQDALDAACIAYAARALNAKGAAA